VEGLPEPDLSIHAIGLGRDARGLDGRRKNQVALLARYGLAPTSRVLEIGCGVGWLAYDLASHLDDAGSYWGFDVSPAAIGWLNENLAPRLANFHFDLVDARNPRYRPDDGAPAERVSFPYSDRQFDLVCAFGVFMHVERSGIERYLSEIARVLETGRPALLSFMAVTPLDTAPRNGTREYVEVEPGVYTSRPDRVGWSLAFDDAVIRDMIERAGLTLVTFEEGAWHGRRPSGGDAIPGADLYVVSPAA
jgi:SAM-dependent methyltransferase